MQSTTPQSPPAVPGAPTLTHLYSPTVAETSFSQGIYFDAKPLTLSMLPSSSSSQPMPPSYPPTPYPPATPAATSTPTVLRTGSSHPDLRVRAHMNALSASFSAMAEQLQAASKTFVSATPGASAGPSLDPSAVLAALNELSSRIDKVERAQTMLNEDFDDLRSQMDRLSTTSDSRVQSSAASEIQEEHTPKPSEKRTPGIAEEDMEAVMGRVTTQLETRIAELIENFRLDQSRLYARLHNATCTQQKMQIKPLPMKNGKTPANFPNTKGEFEHLTKERYEYILKSYDQPIRGDTAAKRDACRVFLGLPPP